MSLYVMTEQVSLIYALMDERALSIQTLGRDILGVPSENNPPLPNMTTCVQLFVLADELWRESKLQK